MEGPLHLEGTAASSAQFPLLLPGIRSSLRLAAKYSLSGGTLISEACAGNRGLTVKLLQLQPHEASDEAEGV